MNISFNSKEFVRGDKKSFDYIVNLYEKRVYGLIYNMVRNNSIAEDITQDVFIKVYQNCYKYNPDLPIEPWLFKIAYNITVNYIKKNKIQQVPIEEEIIKLPGVEDYIERLEVRHIISKEIQALKPEYKAIFILRIMEDLPFEQIALLMESTTASVKLKFYRCRKIVIKNLKKSLMEV